VSAACKEVRSLLGLGLALTEPAREHLRACSACAAVEQEFAALDALMAAEPVPTAPLDFASAVMQIVIGWQQADALRFRMQVAGILAAAAVLALVAHGLVLPFIEGQPAIVGDGTIPLYELVFASAQGLLDHLAGRLSDLLGTAVTLTPTPPMILLLVVGPALLLVNWSISRSAQLSRSPQ